MQGPVQILALRDGVNLCKLLKSVTVPFHLILCFIFMLSNIFLWGCTNLMSTFKRKCNSVPLPRSRVQSQLRRSTAGARRLIMCLKEDVGMKVPCKDICPMHWHPSHATKSAASPSRCLWSINNKLLLSFTANAANNTPVRLREGGWQIHNSPVNRFSHTLHNRPSPAVGTQPTCIMGQLWAHSGTSSGVSVTQRVISHVWGSRGWCVGQGDAQMLTTSCYLVTYCFASRLCEYWGQRSHEFIRSLWSKCSLSMY